MHEENLKALQERIQASFERARSTEPPAPKKMSEQERLTQQQTCIEFLYRAAVKQLG
jgi:hypothetical protein